MGSTANRARRVARRHRESDIKEMLRPDRRYWRRDPFLPGLPRAHAEAPLFHPLERVALLWWLEVMGGAEALESPARDIDAWFNWDHSPNERIAQ